MLDGQIHDVPQVAAVINTVRDKLKETVGELKSVAVAAAGRALYTMTATAEMEVHGLITAEQQSTLDFNGVQLAQSKLAESHTIEDRTSYYCVGFSVISYFLLQPFQFFFLALNSLHIKSFQFISRMI